MDIFTMDWMQFLVFLVRLTCTWFLFSLLVSVTIRSIGQAVKSLGIDPDFEE